jgi:hypothetical protein
MSTLPPADLETAYELLAEAIDRAGAEREALFLARLALALAHECGDIAAFRRAVEIADLAATPPLRPGADQTGPG